MSDQPRFTSPPLTSPRQEKNTRSKSRLLRQTKPIYLTDGQPSSDHTNISSQKSILKLEYESKIRKLEKQNHQLKELLVSLRASQYYELDQEKIKSIIRQNDSLKTRVSQLQSDIHLLDQELSHSLVQNSYLKRNNLALKQDLQKLIKESVRQKHNYFALPAKKTIYTSNTYNCQENESIQERNQLKEKQATDRMNKLMEKRKMIEGQIQKEKQKTQKEKEKLLLNESKEKYRPIVVDNQESVDSIQHKSKKLSKKQRSTTSRYRSSSKSGQKLLLNSILSSKALTKRPTLTKKQPSQNIVSTAQSTSCHKSRHHNRNSTHQQLNLRTQQKSRQPVLPITTSRSPNAYESSGSGTEYAKRKHQLGMNADYNQEYYLEKRQQGIKKKKTIYYI